MPIQLQEIDPQDLIEEDTFLLYFMKFISNLDNKEAEKIHKDMPLTYNDRPQTPVISNHNRSDSAVTNRYQESPIVQEQIRGQVSKTPSKKTGKPPIPPSVNTPGRKSINTSQDRMAHIEVEEEDTFEINVIQKHAINSLRKSDEMMIKEMPTEYKPSLIKKTEDGKAPELRDRSNFLRKNDDQSEESSLTRKNQDLNLEESVKPRIIQEEAPLRSKLYIENGPKEIIRKSYEEPTRKNDEYRPAINSYTAKLQEESQNEAPQRPPQQSKYEAKPVPEIVQEAVIE